MKLAVFKHIQNVVKIVLTSKHVTLTAFLIGASL